MIDDMQKRKYTYKLYPNNKQAQAMLGQLRLHQQLYNAALEERIDAYRKTGQTVVYNDPQAGLTPIRLEHPEYKALPCTSERMTLRRLDKAMQAFFRRVKRGQTPGFPRFKSINRFSSFELMSPKFAHGENGKHGRLFIPGVGHIKARGRCPSQGIIKTSQVKHKHGQWWVSLTIEGEASGDSSQSKACAIDWGVAHLLTIVEENGDHQHIANPRYYQTQEQQQTSLQQAVSRKKRGSRRWKKACKALSTFKRKQANGRKDDHHKLSAKIADNYALVAMEKLQVKNMTGSAKGTSQSPGKNVAQKSGLNQEILDTAPARLMSLIRCKVEETGGEFVETPTKKLKPSQRCPKCAHTHKDHRKTQAEFLCQSCRFEQNADVVSGINSLFWALGLGREDAPVGYSTKPLLSQA